MTFLLLGAGYLHRPTGVPDPSLIKAGGAFGIMAALFAWYNALAGIADTGNRYVVPKFLDELVSLQTASCLRRLMPTGSVHEVRVQDEG